MKKLNEQMWFLQMLAGVQALFITSLILAFLWVMATYPLATVCTILSLIIVGIILAVLRGIYLSILRGYKTKISIKEERRMNEEWIRKREQTQVEQNG